ncbi:MAG: methyltransferase [Chitinophagaceae bacterium]|nr:MAG: methyltransferase [Chitinophagaceae bacterium]
MNRGTIYLIVLVLATQQITAFGQDSLGFKKTLLFADDFSDTTTHKNWALELGGEDQKTCVVKNGYLELNTVGGVTAWYKKELQGNVLIEFDRTVVMEGGPNDRLSDLNQFWMATDPTGKLFTRKGDFKEYDSLRLYYVGIGGNYNTTTRMRRYDGNGKLEIVGEFKDSGHLLQPNKTYHIAILVRDDVSSFYVDGRRFFSYRDTKPFTHGWFGIRSTKSRQRIDRVRIWQIE